MSLSAFRDYCRRKADDPDADLRDRELWAQLADETDAYLAHALGDDPGSDDPDQPDLFS